LGSWLANQKKSLLADIQEFDKILFNVIEERRRSKLEEETTPSSQDRPLDLLDLMISSVDEESGKGLNNEELRSNMVIFFLAGHDTTAHSLSAALFLLASNPEQQDLARDEVRRIVGIKHDLATIEKWDDKDGKPTRAYIPDYEEQRECDYLTAVVKETLRLFPAVPNLPSRMTTKDVSLGGVTIPAHTVCSINIFSLHHSEKLWKDPFKFKPERFMKKEGEEGDEGLKYPYGWNPFGGSVRSCIGQEFSMIEQRMFLGAILLRYRIKTVPGSEEIRLKPGMVLTAPKDLLVKFERL